MSASKRDILVRKAMEVLYRDGFQATGMDKLVRETGVSKMTIYKHFRTKEDLILAALRLRDEEFMNRFVRRVERDATTPKERLLAIFDAMDAWINGGDFQGCMFIKAASEFQDRKHPIHMASAEHKQALLAYFLALAQKAAAKNPRRLAGQLLMLMEGETVMAFMLGKQGVAEDAKKAAKVLIDQALIH